MIWYWKIDIVLKRYLVRLMDSELMIFDWLKIGGSFASGDIPGVLLKSVEFSETVISEEFGIHCTGG